MLDSKFVFTLATLVAIVMAVCKTDASPTPNEGFWMTSVPRTTQAVTLRKQGNTVTAMGQNYGLSSPASTAFLSTPGFSSMPPPRFDTQQLSSTITYNAPTEKYMASTPSDPLGPSCNNTRGSVEGYGCTRGCGSQCTCRASASNTEENDSYQAALRKLRGDGGVTQMSSAPVPVGDLTTTANADGEAVPTVHYQQYMFATAKNRLRQHGDMIRGDLPINPDCTNTGWFKVSANPATALHAGALAVMGGLDMDTPKQVAKLQFMASGGHVDTIAGVDMTANFQSELGSSFSGVNVQTF